ncbi:MAG: IS21 family transposase [Micrococcales bacterium]|nr:IS21 family transposase [Micrococcales bacterium]
MVVDYKRILQMSAAGVSQRGISDVTSFSRNTVAAVLGAAKARGVVYDDVARMEPAAVREMLLPKQTRESGRTPPDFAEVHKELARPNVTLQLLWNEYAVRTRLADGVPYSYTQFTHLYRTWVKVTGATMRIERRPGERIEVDWAGNTMTFIDPGTGAARTADLFVAVLAYSVFYYIEAFADMALESWIEGNVAAFEAFGGTARFLVPDNLKTGVTKADRYEPVLNPAYAQMAEHYGTVVMPARVGAPRDKSAAENAVRHGANAVSAALRHRRFVSLAELNEAIAEQVEMLNAKPFQKRQGSRAEVFAAEEAPVLNPLPETRFEIASLKTAKVGPNYHIQVLTNFYSVPSTLIGKQLDVRVTSRLIEVFDGPTRVASHTRLREVKGRYQTLPEHMPEAHRAQSQEWSPGRFISWAGEIGPNTQAVIRAILGSKKIVEQTYRSCLGVMSLAKKTGGTRRLEDTCAKAREASISPSYTLVRRLWATWEPVPPPARSLGDAGFVRGAAYYAGQEDGR